MFIKITGKVILLGAALGGAAAGAGFTLFTQSDNDPGIYADATARDVYFDANQSEIDRVADDEFLIIKLLDGGTGDIAYQQYLGVSGVPNVPASWGDVTSLVQGETGAAGATGNSYFFASIAKRDTFFNQSPNEGLLETGLPVVVNEGTAVTTFEWVGVDAPVSYDAALFRSVALNSAPGKLFLGLNGAQLSSAAKTINFTSAFGDKALPTGVFFDPKGSVRPLAYLMEKEQTFVVSDVFDTQLPGPFEFLFTGTTFASYTEGWFVRPATTGTLTLKSFAGNSASDPEVTNFTVEIGAGDIGNIVSLPAPNGLLAIGDEQFLTIEGVELFGGTQTSGAFSGQVKAFLEATVHIVTLSRLLDARDKDTYVTVNEEYTSTTPTTGGFISVVSATGLGDSFTGATFTPGVDGVSNPTVETVSTATYAPGDLVAVNVTIGPNTPDANCGIYEVESHVGTLLTVRGVGVDPLTHDFPRGQFEFIESTGTLEKVEVAVLRVNSAGFFETGKGSSTPIAFAAVTTQATLPRVFVFDSDNALVTSSTSGTYEEINAVLGLGPDSQDFIVVNGTDLAVDNTLEYTGVNTLFYELTANISAIKDSGNTNATWDFEFFINDVTPAGGKQSAELDNSHPNPVTSSTVVALSTGDKITVKQKRLGGTNDIRVTDVSILARVWR